MWTDNILVDSTTLSIRAVNRCEGDLFKPHFRLHLVKREVNPMTKTLEFNFYELQLKQAAFPVLHLPVTLFHKIDSLSPLSNETFGEYYICATMRAYDPKQNAEVDRYVLS